MQSNLNEATHAWLCFMKYFFELYLNSRSYQINDGHLVLECWKQMCSTLKLNYDDDINEAEDEKTSKKAEKNDEEMKSDNEDDELSEQQQQRENSTELISYFLARTIDYINNFSASNSAKQYDAVRFAFATHFQTFNVRTKA